MYIREASNKSHHLWRNLPLAWSLTCMYTASTTRPTFVSTYLQIFGLHKHPNVFEHYETCDSSNSIINFRFTNPTSARWVYHYYGCERLETSNSHSHTVCMKTPTLLPTQKWITHAEVTFTLWGFCTGKFQHGRQNSRSTGVDATCQQSQCKGF